jgi:hypothetical protein
MVRVPTLNEAAAKFQVACDTGQGIDSLSPVEQMIVKYTPMFVFRAWTFRKQFARILTKAVYDQNSDSIITAFVNKYAPSTGKGEFTIILRAAIAQVCNQHNEVN